MRDGLKAVQAALDAAAAPVRLFLRDDDAGWDDARLFKLLDCVELAGVPIDLAVIPQACSDALAQALCARIDAVPARLGVHQHGYAHTNHETVARKCEFGAARSVAAQRDDLRNGRERLHRLFGARLDAIFTPPWNRCAAATPLLLAELGYSALSRDRGAPAQDALPEVAVDVDWCKQRAGGDDAIGMALARSIGADHAGRGIGVMLHHAVMDAHDLLLLQALFKATAGHPRARWVSINDVLAGATQLFDLKEEIL
jgi:hypothetical protein